jgi:NAD(P)-dependent dehydrogenase (short-subunit alcohol dehydrogenase family)
VATDVTDEASVAALFEKAVQSFGRVDVLINNAGVSAGHTSIDQMDLAEWWINFEVNVKGLLLATKYFARQIGDAPGTIVSVTSTGAFNEPEVGAGYTLSKFAGIKFIRQLGVSRPNLTVVAMHPGLVKTRLLPVYMEKFGLDTPELAGGVAVWLTTPTAKFLSGRYISANWSVDELYRRRDEIIGEDLLRLVLSGKIGQQ